MLELLGARELTEGEPAVWDVVPQIQVSLSARQHVLLNAGVRVPLNRRDERRASVLVYLLWDWFDGGLLQRMVAAFSCRAIAVVSVACALSLLAEVTARDVAQQSVTGSVSHTGPLFKTSENCLACHNGLITPGGEDVSIGTDWRASTMANSSRDPYWQAAVRREVMDHPGAAAEIEDECATCHMPMSRSQAARSGRRGGVFAHLPVGQREEPEDLLAHDGVSCTMCHQISSAKLGKPESFSGGFVLEGASPSGARAIFGPFQVDRGRTTVMQSATGFTPTEAAHMRQSEMCATCHTLYTKARGPGGQVIGELPEQVPYLEWRYSAFPADQQSCQSCHMPVVREETPIASVLGTPRQGVARHVFRGGNFFILRMLNRYRAELGVKAMPQEIDAAARSTVDQLRSETAVLTVGPVGVSGGRLEFTVTVENTTGHKLPTAYPSRRMWVHVAVRDRLGYLRFESGKPLDSGAIQGNDADVDPARFEPHYTEIRDADQVQIYESIMADSAGAVTTGLLTAVRYVKDNRLLPRGFRKESAPRDVAVVGHAAEDADFTAGGDKTRYSLALDTDGPFQIDVALRFQPIGFRWAQNLKGYDAAETTRFVSYFDSMSKAATEVIGHMSTWAFSQ